MTYALGLVETKGLIGAITAADAMAKAADVKVMGKEKINPALVTIQVIGEVAAVRSAVEAGAAAASRVGQLVATHIIPRPDIQLVGLYPELAPGNIDSPDNSISAPADEPINPVQSSAGVQDSIDSTEVSAQVSEESASETEVSDTSVTSSTDAPVTETEVTETKVAENKVTEVVVTETEEVLPIEASAGDTEQSVAEVEVKEPIEAPQEEPAVAEPEPTTAEVAEQPESTETDVTDTAEVSAEEIKEEVTPATEEAGAVDTPDAAVPSVEVVAEETDVPAPEEPVKIKEQVNKKEKLTRQKKAEPDLFSQSEPETGFVFEEAAVTTAVEETVAAVSPETEQQTETAGEEVSESTSDEVDVALLQQVISENIVDIVPEVPVTPEITAPAEPEPVAGEGTGETKNKEEAGAQLKELEMLNVEELRRLARTYPHFPIKGREISKAGRKDLLDYFRQLL